MSRTLKSLHYISISLGFLAVAAVVLNLVVFLILFPQVTQLMEQHPSWDTFGIIVNINIIILAFFQLCSVLTLLAHLIVQKKTSTITVLAIVIGILSGIMILGDITLLSDIGKEYAQGWQTRGEWLVLFASYGLHFLSMILGLITLIKNLNQKQISSEQVIKDEVLFLSLHTSGVICGIIGLAGVFTGALTGLSLWMMERLVIILSLIILSPYLVTLVVWLLRRKLGDVMSGLDEKQFQDLAAAGLWTMIFSLPVMIIFFGLQLSSITRDTWTVLWLPLLIFFSLTFFSGFSLRRYSY